MADLEFSVPYNNDPDTLTEILKLKKLGGNTIREIYLSGPQELYGSGRLMTEISRDDFFTAVDRIHQADLRVNLTLNPTCEGSEWYSTESVSSIFAFLRIAHLEYGVEAVTIANPVFVKLARSTLPHLEICASVLGDIDSVEKAAQFAEAGADIITPDVGVNRDLRLLNKIKAVSGAKIKLMVNEGCLYRCAYRKFHFNLTSHRSREARGIALTRGGDVYADFFRHCVERSANDLSQVIKSCWIRPEDLSKYGEITDYFKIVGRCQPKDKVVQDISAYMQQNWSGNLFDLLCASLQRFGVAYNAYIDNRKLEEFRFFEKVTSCDRDCDSCNYCDELAAKLIQVVLPDGKMISASALSADAVNTCD